MRSLDSKHGWGSIPVIECYRIAERRGTSNSWGFVCSYCRVIHLHKAGEDFRSNICITPEGQAAFKYGYYLRLASSS